LTTTTPDAPSAAEPVPLLDLKLQYAAIRDDVMGAIERICQSQRFIGGPEVVACEGAVAAYCGCKAGDEVIVPSFTFFATAGCVSRLGARPVFVDVDSATFNVTAEHIERAISPRTKLIIPVHLFGQCADMDAIGKVADRRGIPVMEDAAQSICARHHGRPACSMGRLGTLSFFPSKNLGAFGDAGMIVTNDVELAERCRILRDHGMQPRYYHKWVGGNFRLDAIQAAVVRIKLQHLDGWSARRVENARRYNELFAGSIVKTPVIAADNDSIFNQYVIRVPRRDELKKHLESHGIGSEIYYPVPLHLQECFADLGGRPGDLPVSEQAAGEVLAIPIYPELTLAQQERVAHTIRGFYGERA
jgi:dTDP-4-amino-4,6-dideoxygalactose transaminase